MSSYTRREFTKFALAALPAAGLLTLPRQARGADAMAGKSGKPNSAVNGVHIGLNVPYSFGNEATTADEVLAACVSLGVSFLELRAQPVEGFLGIPENLVARRGARTDAKEKNAKKEKAPVDREAGKAKAEELRRWRMGVTMDRVRDFRKKYNDAGVAVEILKVDGLFTASDEELEYYFNMA